MRWKVILPLVGIVVLIVVTMYARSNRVILIPKEELAAEKFVKQFLLTEDNFIKTNLTDRENVYLSESVGLWLEYLLLKQDFDQFDMQVTTLKQSFLTKDNLVVWKIENGKRADANAFIDDLRIIDSLYRAGELWNYRPYKKLADQMSKQLISDHELDGHLVDHIDLTTKHQGDVTTMSYIIPTGLQQMEEAGLLPSHVLETTKRILIEAPFKGYFLPKAYNLSNQSYVFDEEINLIDQFYAAYNRAQWKGDIMPLLNFAKEEFESRDGKLYGRYDSFTNEPVVSYESPSVYALAILMSLEVGDTEFAKDLYTQMKKLQYVNGDGEFSGGYIDPNTMTTHSFDNIFALIAERKGLDEEAF